MKHHFNCSARLRLVTWFLAAFVTNFVLLILPAKAIILFDNPSAIGQGTQWCDPCSSGNIGYRVWDSFTLAQRSTVPITPMGSNSRSDALTLGVELEIALAPDGTKSSQPDIWIRRLLEATPALNSSFRKLCNYRI